MRGGDEGRGTKGVGAARHEYFHSGTGTVWNEVHTYIRLQELLWPGGAPPQRGMLICLDGPTRNPTAACIIGGETTRRRHHDSHIDGHVRESFRGPKQLLRVQRSRVREESAMPPSRRVSGATARFGSAA